MAKKKATKRGRKPLGDKKRVDLALTVGPKTDRLVRQFARHETMTMGKAGEYLILLGIEHLMQVGDGDVPSYEAVTNATYELNAED